MFATEGMIWKFVSVFKNKLPHSLRDFVPLTFVIFFFAYVVSVLWGIC